MKSDSRDGPVQPPATLNQRRPRSADSHSQSRYVDRRDDSRPTRQRAVRVSDDGAPSRPASSSPAVGDRRRRPPLGTGCDGRFHVVPRNYHDVPCPVTRQGRSDVPRYQTEIFVVPSPPVSLPPSTRLDRIISPLQFSGDDQCDWDAPTTDNDERRVSNRTIFDVALRHRSLVAAVVCVFTFLSPLIMVSIPRPSAAVVGRTTSDGVNYDCNEDCESAILSLSVRLIVVAVGSLVVFTSCSSCRMWSASVLPRLEDVETVLTAVVLLIAVVFWSFYAVHIAGRGVVGDTDYGRTVSFAGSMADTLLFVHGLAALVLGLRGRSTAVDFVVHVVRSPDGRSATFSVSAMSIQHLALICLRRCCVELDAQLDTSGTNTSCLTNKSGDYAKLQTSRGIC